MTYYNVISSPIGPITTVVDERGAAVAVHFGEVQPVKSTRDAEKTQRIDGQLGEYFAGQRKSFDLELAANGTEFQQRVWRALVGIPFGETRSYGHLARQLGCDGASRAVGRANATNPIAIIVPCHRVIGSNGTLTGYAGGLDVKQKLLQFEQGLTASLFG